jgi:Mrp family chromosome partitioning ATPase
MMVFFGNNQRVKTVPDLFDDPEFSASLKRTAVNFVRLSEVSKKKAFLITGSSPLHKKSPVAAVLAYALAQEGKRTLLVADSRDLRKWRLEQDQDYRDSLNTADQMYAIPSAQPNLLALGISEPSGLELYDRGKTVGFLEHAKTSFDFVIVDFACLYSHPLPLFLTTLVDGVILLVRLDTSKSSALFVKKKVDEAGGELVGVIMSQMTCPIPPAIMRQWNLD